MLDQLIQFKVLMVVKVDNVEIMEQAVAVEHSLLEVMVVVVQLYQELVELQLLMQLLELPCLMLAEEVVVHKVHRLNLELEEQVLLVEQVVVQEVQTVQQMEQLEQLLLVVAVVEVVVETNLLEQELEEMVVQELLY
tara:strand:- start:11 stop:421 length:411 start_codon:yes stop_codon:yes gene_type:complete